MTSVDLDLWPQPFKMIIKFNHPLNPCHIPKFGAVILITKEIAVLKVPSWTIIWLLLEINRQMGKQTTPANSIAHHQWAKVCKCLLRWYGQHWWPQFPFMVLFILQGGTTTIPLTGCRPLFPVPIDSHCKTKGNVGPP